MWPGAPSTSGLRGMLPGVCEPSGSESISVAIAMTGFPDPHFAHTLVGNPAPPTFTVSPICSNVALRNFRGLVFLHPRFAIIINDVAHQCDWVGISVDRVERNALEIGRRVRASSENEAK